MPHGQAWRHVQALLHPVESQEAKPLASLDAHVPVIAPHGLGPTGPLALYQADSPPLLPVFHPPRVLSTWGSQLLPRPQGTGGSQARASLLGLLGRTLPQHPCCCQGDGSSPTLGAGQKPLGEATPGGGGGGPGPGRGLEKEWMPY